MNSEDEAVKSLANGLAMAVYEYLEIKAEYNNN